MLCVWGGLPASLNKAGVVLSTSVIGQLLVLAVQRVDTGTVGNPLERIVDARQMPQLCQRVCQALPLGSEQNPEQAFVRRFLENRFELAPDPSTYIGQATRIMTVLSDALRLECIVSKKTEQALAKLL